MLEKTRVVLDYPHEKNFHIFYYLMTGLDKELMKKLHLVGIQSHKYLIIILFLVFLM
jgi:myosin heavy subunit